MMSAAELPMSGFTSILITIGTVDYTARAVISSQLWQRLFCCIGGAFNDGHQLPIISGGHHSGPVLTLT